MTDQAPRLMEPRDPVEALILLSRWPLPALSELRGARAAWAYPVAGAFIALPAALICGILSAASVPPPLLALIGLAFITLTTGALHEDGLADCADGFWGGTEPARRLEIMKDSRVGSYGVLALVFSICARWASLWWIFTHSTGAGICALIAGAMLSRATMPVLMWLLPPARPSGLAGSVGDMPAPTAALSAGTGIVAALLLTGWPGLMGVLIATGLLILWGKTAQTRVGGYTGDVLGGAQQLAEIAFLCTIASGF